MKSFNGSGFLSNGPLYSLLAVYMPLSTLTAVVLLLRALLLKTYLPINIPFVFLIAAGLVSALTASFYNDFMKDAKSDRIAANTRGGIIIVCVSYIFASLLRRGIPRREIFLPNLFNIPVALGALFVWVEVLLLKQLFSVRRNFEVYTESYKDEQLREKIFEDSSLLQYTNENIDKIKRNYFVQLVVIGILAFICINDKISLPLALYFLLAVILVGGVCIFSFFGIIKWEHYYAGEGIAVSSADRAGRVMAMAVFTMLCFLCAILLASDKSVLPFSLVKRFFAWFFTWFFGLFRIPVRFEENAASEDFLGMGMESPLSQFDEAAPSSIWTLIAKYISIVFKYGFIALVAGCFIRFMISPLLNRGDVSKKMSFFRRLIRIIAEWLKGALCAIVYFFAHLKDGDKLRLRRQRAKEIRETAETLFGAYSPAKKRDIRRSVTLFARLIIWGCEARGIKWAPTFAPGEFCAMLASAAPEDDLQKQNEGIIRCGELFEKAIYSADVLSDDERKEFKELVEEITSVL